MKSGDFLEMLMGELEGKESIDDQLKREAEKALQAAYVNNFARVGVALLFARLLNKEERTAVLDIVHALAVQNIEKECPGDLDAIAVCAKTKESLIDTMNALAVVVNREQ